MGKRGGDIPPRIAKMEADDKPKGKKKRGNSGLGKGAGVDGQNMKGKSKKRPAPQLSGGTGGFGDGRQRFA
jgi:hypothetical protein